MLSINDISLLKSQNEGLKKQNKELQEEIKKYAAINEQETKDYAELKAENEQLYEEKDCLHKIIDRLLENAGYSKDIASAEDFENVYENMQYNRQKLSEYKQTLQEIKAIADAPKPFIDFSVIKTATEVGYDYATICNELELRLHKVLELITKEEEE